MLIYDYFDPLLFKVILLNFHPFEVVPRHRDPQIQVGEHESY